MPKLILLTHAHFDHMLGLDAWRKLGIPLAVHRMDAPALGDPAKSYFRPFLHREDVFMPPEQELEEGTVIPLGNEFLRVLHTPGHTMGSVCYLGDGVIFTGDTVFTDGDYGRTDLYGGDEVTLFSSIRRLSQLPEKEGDLVMYPGHGGEGNFRAHMKFFG